MLIHDICLCLSDTFGSILMRWMNIGSKHFKPPIQILRLAWLWYFFKLFQLVSLKNGTQGKDMSSSGFFVFCFFFFFPM